MTDATDQIWHALPVSEVARLLQTEASSGLTQEEAEKRLSRIGRNTIEARAGIHPALRFLQQFQNPLVYVLLIAGAVTALMPDHQIEAGVIFGVLFLNAIIGFIQESRAQMAIESLGRLLAPAASVIRNSEIRRIPAEELVPGDVVRLQSGDRVPGDIRCTRIRDLHVDESMLTGESLPVAKECVDLESDVSLPDRKNMLYSGAVVTSGQSTGLVVATGARSEIGRISRLIATTEMLETPLTRKISRFSKLLSYAILFLSLLTFAIGILQGHLWNEMFIAAVALAVAAIPEGLPAALTIILAIGVSRMARRNALIRKLPAVEALGSATVICSDKTGTLTKNEMTVTRVYAAGEHLGVTGAGYEPAGEITSKGTTTGLTERPALVATITSGVLCNDSNLVQREGRWIVEGDPTEVALLALARKAGIEPPDLRAQAREIDVVPFESAHKYMASLHAWPDGRRAIYVKGAVEEVVGMCELVMEQDEAIRPIDRETILAVANEYAGDGFRVLAFATKSAPRDQSLLHHEDLQGALVFVGLQAMLDPPRPEAVAAVKATQQAGIEVKMITGDHPLTARTIAHACGIGGTAAAVMTGADLDSIDEQAFPEVAERTDVFARVTPEQKLQLVEAFQSRGEVVAMTGDGVNDAPALKRADIGVAMGIAGTEAARDAADMVLTDDNFASIEAAVEEGRGVYDNLRKFITWTLPTNGGESLLLLVAIAAGLTLPLEPVHVLWINMTTAVALGTTLAFEPKESGIMRRPARPPNEPILTGELLLRIGYVSVLMTVAGYALFFWSLARGSDLSAARTLVTTTVIAIELGYLFTCRSLSESSFRIGLLSNPWAVAGAISMVVLQAAFVYLPTMHRLFSSAPLSLVGWGDVGLVAIFVFGVVEFEKWLRRSTSARSAAN